MVFGINNINKTSKEHPKRRQDGGDHLKTLDDTTKPVAKPHDSVVKPLAKPHDDASDECSRRQRVNDSCDVNCDLCYC